MGKRVNQNPVYYERTCPDCGEQVLLHIKSKRCPECQRLRNAQHNAEYRARKREGKSRTIGSQYACERCGTLYELESGQQRWCPACAPAMHKVVDRQLSVAWNKRTYADPVKRDEKNARRRRDGLAQNICKTCGNEFSSGSAHDVYCSDACRTAGSKANAARFEAEHKDQRRQYHADLYKAKIAAMTPAEREQYRIDQNRIARENYAKRKAKKEAANHD